VLGVDWTLSFFLWETSFALFCSLQNSLAIVFNTTMMLRLLATAALLLSSVSAESAICARLPTVEDGDKYHSDAHCDRAGYNRFRDSLNRHLTYRALKEMKGIGSVPDEKTVVCPLEAKDLTEKGQTTGFDTVWMVENTASTSVVLAFVKNGAEFSAMNPKITPPQKDPSAILKPGQWKPVYTYEGHTFHARELRADGTLGDVLLQHRVGLIPVGANADNLECPLDDPEPIKNPNFKRTPPVINRPCHTLDIGFRNLAGCPLHGYYVRTDEDVCEENFKFHLGVNPLTDDFMWSWQSPTKFESSYVGHSFAFRLASNPSILVDTITLQPTKIVDCPKPKTKVGISVSNEAVILPVIHNIHQNDTMLNATKIDFNSTMLSSVMYASAGFASL